MNRYKEILFCTLVIYGFLSSCATSDKKHDGVSSATLNEKASSNIEIAQSSKCAIVLFSASRNNTAKVAKEMASVLHAQILSPETATPEILMKYDLIGFGSGIFDQKHHTRILEIAEQLSESDGQKVFIFSTSGVSRVIDLKHGFGDPHEELRNILNGKDYDVVGEFNCTGLNKNSFLILVGGINKGRPNSIDLQNARAFAEGLIY